MKLTVLDAVPRAIHAVHTSADERVYDLSIAAGESLTTESRLRLVIRATREDIFLDGYCGPQRSYQDYREPPQSGPNRIARWKDDEEWR